jgi:hypothetical protein
MPVFEVEVIHTTKPYYNGEFWITLVCLFCDGKIRFIEVIVR